MPFCTSSNSSEDDTRRYCSANRVTNVEFPMPVGSELGEDDFDGAFDQHGLVVGSELGEGDFDGELELNGNGT